MQFRDAISSRFPAVVEPVRASYPPMRATPRSCWQDIATALVTPVWHDSLYIRGTIHRLFLSQITLVTCQRRLVCRCMPYGIGSKLRRIPTECYTLQYVYIQHESYTAPVHELEKGDSISFWPGSLGAVPETIHKSSIRAFNGFSSLQVGSILIRASSNPERLGEFEMDYSNDIMRASLRPLIMFIDLWTHLFPDTPKMEALRSSR